MYCLVSQSWRVQCETSRVMGELPKALVYKAAGVMALCCSRESDVWPKALLLSVLNTVGPSDEIREASAF